MNRYAIYRSTDNGWAMERLDKELVPAWTAEEAVENITSINGKYLVCLRRGMSEKYGHYTWVEVTDPQPQKSVKIFTRS